MSAVASSSFILARVAASSPCRRWTSPSSTASSDGTLRAGWTAYWSGSSRAARDGATRVRATARTPLALAGLSFIVHRQNSRNDEPTWLTDRIALASRERVPLYGALFSAGAGRRGA